MYLHPCGALINHLAMNIYHSQCTVWV